MSLQIAIPATAVTDAARNDGAARATTGGNKIALAKADIRVSNELMRFRKKSHIVSMYPMIVPKKSNITYHPFLVLVGLVLVGLGGTVLYGLDGH